MEEDKILMLYQAIPEFDYMHRWCEAMDRKQYEDALVIIKEGLKFAEKRDSQFIKYLRELAQKTKLSLKEASADPKEKAKIRKKREGRFSCSFCGKKRAEVSVLIAAASGFICDECVQVCYEIVEERLPANPEKQAKFLAQGEDRISCFSCGKKPAEVSLLVAGPKVFICDGCIKTCHEIIMAKRPGPKPVKPAKRIRKSRK